MNEKQRLITSLQKYAFNLIMLYFEQVVPNDGYAHDILEELVNEETEIKEYETAKEMYIDTIKSYDSDKQALLDITNTMLQEYISNILTWSERFTTHYMTNDRLVQQILTLSSLSCAMRLYSTKKKSHL